MKDDAVPVTAEIDEAKVGRRMLVMVPRPNALVITDCAKQAACELIGNDIYGKPVWTVDTISPENRVVQAFARFERDILARFERDILARHRGSTAGVDVLKRVGSALDDMVKHLGGRTPTIGATHYRWASMPTVAEVQNALEALNEAAAALASLSQTPATPMVQEVLREVQP